MSDNTTNTNENGGAAAARSPVETAGEVLAKEARLFGRVAAPAEREVFDALAKALRDPGRVAAFIGKAS